MWWDHSVYSIHEDNIKDSIKGSELSLPAHQPEMMQELMLLFGGQERNMPLCSSPRVWGITLCKSPDLTKGARRWYEKRHWGKYLRCLISWHWSPLLRNPNALVISDLHQDYSVRLCLLFLIFIFEMKHFLAVPSTLLPSDLTRVNRSVFRRMSYPIPATRVPASFHLSLGSSFIAFLQSDLSPGSFVMGFHFAKILANPFWPKSAPAAGTKTNN